VANYSTFSRGLKYNIIYLSRIYVHLYYS